MKWITCKEEEKERVGWVTLYNGIEYVITLEAVSKWLIKEEWKTPTLVDTLLELIEAGEELQQRWTRVATYLESEPHILLSIGKPLKEVTLLAPIPRPPSLRDFYAFENHVKNARKRRGLEMIPEWYEIPVFYFSNHRSIHSPFQEVKRPSTCKWLDYELEIACVIGKEGRNISAKEASDYIFGYMIMNDWSARDLQREEMKVGLGPAKGKDFATSFGPYLVTPDELEAYRISNGRYNLEMTASVNGKPLSHGNFRDIYYTFAEMIERASQDVTLYPGDVIGSGTVGTGCILELGPEVHPWLKPGDLVTLSITGLGSLTNTII